MIECLTGISDDMTALLPLFVDGGKISGLILPTEHSATFKTLVIEAKSMLDEELGRDNEYSMNLLHAVNTGAGGFSGGPSYASIDEASKIISASVRTIKRKLTRVPALQPVTKPFVDQSRIVALQAISNGKWDFARLVELCREINVAWDNQCHMSTAMLLRSILDHVPPVLGFNTFAEIANNYGGSKSQRSFKATMGRLQGSQRSIADMHLHTPIRAREDVPTAVQVNFAAELDSLLGEVIRVSGEA